MNTSSFISGVLIGAAATAIMSKNKGSITSAITQNAGKMMDMSSLGMNSAGSHSSGHVQTHSKDESMKQINDFINSNPDVKREVDMIMKETNTVIPGM
ncbi:hypothetical protein P4H66_26445 [Paenibacillus dokdonensis]|uniref:Uncharacterized protein n=1 Tax=Paenibacillus dokdonensis TaxID=2567944 RepID=A0ABU6GVI9_9BACL|nr:hypothetical protein [Paenibacillus dokdonensis]MEC0243359.1 hypothetical protein [Paenibacillus dokdonensis]